VIVPCNTPQIVGSDNLKKIFEVKFACLTNDTTEISIKITFLTTVQHVTVRA
jgi:hypothetical protein